MMAAIRSALAMLGRRSCGSSGSSAAASFVGRGKKEIQHVFRPAATPPLPSVRPAGRNLGSWRQFSTAGREPAKKAEGDVPMWWQRCRNRVNNIEGHDKAMLSMVYSMVVFGGTALYMIKS